MKNTSITEQSLRASLHTVTVRSGSKPKLPPLMNSEVMSANYLQRSQLWSMRINPNKICGDIFTYSEYRQIMGKLFAQIGTPEPIYYRTDIRIDSYEDTFNVFYKANLLIISLFAMGFRKNQGQAIGHLYMLSKDYCDISYSNEYIEMKFYNKKFQTNDADPAKARLEIRCLKSMRTEGLPPHEFADRVIKLLGELVTRFESLQQKCNECLYRAYVEHCNFCSKLKRSRDYTTEFLSNYSNTLTIFTREQLRQFLGMCGLTPTQAYDRADYIISKTHIEFFSKADIRRYVEKLQGVISEFFLN